MNNNNNNPISNNVRFDSRANGEGGITISTTGTTGIDMMGVVTRIQERARTLQEEKRKVIEADAYLGELRSTRDREQKINNRRRKHLLERIRERNDVEIEIFDVQDTIDNHNRSAEEFHRQRLKLEERVESMMKKRTDETISFYGPNISRMEIYKTLLEDIVLTKERVKDQRRQRLETIRNELEEAKMEEESIRTETESIQDDFRRQGVTDSTTFNSEEDGASSGSNKRIGSSDVEEIATLSKRVHETIEQRSNLRKKLKETQQRYDKANEDLLNWEEKHVEMTINKRR